jgi:hypothetical protein
MDNSSFPKILDLKNKMIPNPQLLQLKDWFSKYQFTVQHIKGKTNILVDLLSRPKQLSLFLSSIHKPILMFMIRHHWPPKLHIFSSLASVESYAYSYIFRYKSQFLL